MKKEISLPRSLLKVANIDDGPMLLSNGKHLTGAESANGLRERTQYELTEATMIAQGVTEAVKNETPPVAINLQLLNEEVGMMQTLRKEFEHKPIRIAVLGIATASGITHILDFARSSLEASKTTLFAVDINPAVLQEVNALALDNVTALHEDARSTSISAESIDLVIRDHVGNCCPPEVDREINKEAIRILRPGGLSITNITTSELLIQSEDRSIIRFSDLQEMAGDEFVAKLQTEFFDLDDIRKNSNHDSEAMRGILLEIERGESFAIFGSGKSDLDEQVDLIGHGEWFRGLPDHIQMWQRDGFFIEHIRSRSGLDSHLPKLHCLRHIVMLRKR